MRSTSRLLPSLARPRSIVLAACLVGALAPDARATVYWGDVHAHSGLSNDGTGTADNFFTVARDVVGLDFVVLSDHDIFLTPAEWDILRMTAASFNMEGSFVAFTATEWTRDWHMNVYFQQDDVPFCVPCSSPAQFYSFYGPAVQALEAAAHVNHPADPAYAVTWDTIDDSITTNVEVFNVLSGGSQEFGYGNALWALNAGFRLGLVGVSDDHHLDEPPLLIGHGLTGCDVAALARADLLAALRERRCYATSGERILLAFDVNGTGMGGQVSAPIGSSVMANVVVNGTATPSLIEVVRNGIVVASKTDCGGPSCMFSAPVTVQDPHTFIYVRVTQAGDEHAWSSPVWVQGTCPNGLDCLLARLAPGGGRKDNDCLAEWIVTPAPDPGPGAVPRRLVTCHDGDPSCDFGTNPSECLFRVGMCFGVNDSRVSSCVPVAADQVELLRPSQRSAGKRPLDFANYKTVIASLAAFGPSLAAGSCTSLTELVVPIGRRRFELRTTAGTRIDRDNLTLSCLRP